MRAALLVLVVGCNHAPTDDPDRRCYQGSGTLTMPTKTETSPIVSERILDRDKHEIRVTAWKPGKPAVTTTFQVDPATGTFHGKVALAAGSADLTGKLVGPAWAWTSYTGTLTADGITGTVTDTFNDAGNHGEIELMKGGALYASAHSEATVFPCAELGDMRAKLGK